MPPPLFERSQWRVTIADNATITIGNSTDASHAKKLRRIVRDRISIPSNASTNISDSRIRASPLPSLLYIYPNRALPEESFTKTLEKESDSLSSLLVSEIRTVHGFVDYGNMVSVTGGIVNSRGN